MSSFAPGTDPNIMEAINKRLYGASGATPSLGGGMGGGGGIGGGSGGGNIGGLQGIAAAANNLIGDVKDFSSKMVGGGGGGLGATSPSFATQLTSVRGQLGFKKGGKVKAKPTAKPTAKPKSKPKTSSASKRADGIAQRGKTKGRYI